MHTVIHFYGGTHSYNRLLMMYTIPEMGNTWFCELVLVRGSDDFAWIHNSTDSLCLIFIDDVK
jgi:hypothetical protein